MVIKRISSHIHIIGRLRRSIKRHTWSNWTKEPISSITPNLLAHNMEIANDIAAWPTNTGMSPFETLAKRSASADRPSWLHGKNEMPDGHLARNPNDKWLGGVCGGIARWLGWNSDAVRILYVLGSVFSAAFPGTIVYIILWIVMPVEE
jgi:phage shock protein PspC (stress-responsive transcriptional regulator)